MPAGKSRLLFERDYIDEGAVGTPIAIAGGGGQGAYLTQVAEGPGIDVVGASQVGLGGDTVLLYDSGGAPVAEYAATPGGLDAALTAATAGDVVWLPAGTIAGNHTVPAGVTVTGLGDNSVLSGTVTLGDGAVLIYLAVGSATVLYRRQNGATVESLEVFASAEFVCSQDDDHSRFRMVSPSDKDSTLQLYTPDAGGGYHGWALLKDRAGGDFHLNRDDTENTAADTAMIVYRSDSAVALPAGLSGAADDIDLAIHIMAAFREDDTPKLYLEMSGDGITWRHLLSGGVAYTAPLGVLRDPSIVYHDKRFWCAYTNDDDGATPQFTVIASNEHDVGTWSHIADVSLAAVADAYHIWAPEWFIDADGSVHVLVAVSTGGSSSNFQAYEIAPTNEAMTSWGTPTQITGTGLPANMIDPFLVRFRGQYHLWYKNDTTDYIEYASSDSLASGYTVARSGDWANWGNGVEGPSLVQVASGRWRLYYDDYVGVGVPGNGIFYTESTDDWVTWSTPLEVGAPDTFSHPTVILARKEAAIDVLLGLLSATGSVTIRKNSGINIGRRPRINLIEGIGISLGVLDDTSDDEIDVTIAASPIGQYRQFIYTISGSDFTFVKDSEGNPVMALEDLE